MYSTIIRGRQTLEWFHYSLLCHIYDMWNYFISAFTLPRSAVRCRHFRLLYIYLHSRLFDVRGAMWAELYTTRGLGFLPLTSRPCLGTEDDGYYRAYWLTYWRYVSEVIYLWHFIGIDDAPISGASIFTQFPDITPPSPAAFTLSGVEYWRRRIMMMDNIRYYILPTELR